MNLNTSYAFSKQNHIGQASGHLRTTLVEGQTSKGEPAVALCDADSFVPRKDGAALVKRGAEGEWQPIATIKDLQETLTTTPKDKLGEQVGIWTDSRSFLVLGKDGIAQEREVQSLASHWADNEISSTTRFDDLGVRNGDPNQAPQQMTVGWSIADANVRPSEVALLPTQFPGKAVGVLNEPLYVDSHEILRVTSFDDASGQYIPTAVESIKHTPEGSEVTPNAGYDLAPLVYDDLATEYVIAG